MSGAGTTASARPEVEHAAVLWWAGSVVGSMACGVGVAATMTTRGDERMIPPAVWGSRCRRCARVAVSGVAGGCDSIPSLTLVRCHHLDGTVWRRRYGAVVLPYVVNDDGVATLFFCQHDSTLRPYHVSLIASMHQHYSTPPVLPISMPNTITHATPYQPPPRPDDQIRVTAP